MKKRIGYHLIFWTAYVLFKTSLNLDSSIGLNSINLSTLFIHLQGQLAFLLVKVPMVYSLFYITDSFFSKKWNTLKSTISLVLLYICCVGLVYPVVQYEVATILYHQRVPINQYFSPLSIIYNLFILSFTSFLALAIKLIRLYIFQKASAQEIIKKKLETELRFLKSQTNPHFLFNTLNNIYALARKKSDATAETVLKLSNLLRFMLYESQNNSIPISNELKVIESFIELEKIRYSERLTVNYQTNIDNPQEPIGPLILLPFVENAFKHGASESRFESYINIDIALKYGNLQFQISNSKSTPSREEDRKRIGLDNVKRQLELLYPDHSLQIMNGNERFEVILTINLLNHANF